MGGTRLSVAALVLVLCGVEVSYAQETARTSRLPLPSRPVERPIALPRGWFEWRLTGTHDVDRGSFDGARRVSWQQPRSRSIGEVLLRAGVSKRTELWWRAGMVTEAVSAARVVGLNDPAVGARLTVHHREAPATSIVVEAQWEGPGGREGPATLARELVDQTGVSWSSGTNDVYVGAAARRHFGAFRLTGRAGAELRTPGRVAFGIGDLAAGGVLLDPGDRLVGSVEALLQGGPLAGVFALEGSVAQSGRARSAAGWTQVSDSGLEVHLRAGGMLSATRGVDVGLDGVWGLLAPATDLAPNPDLAATWGSVISVWVEVRH